MKQKLDDFIAQNRQAFDDQEPSDKAWQHIAASLPARSWWNSLVLWRAAAVVFMALSVYLFLVKPGGNGASAEEKVALREFHDVEEFYERQMAEKVQLINQFKKAEGLNGFTQDFQQLEAMYQVLKEEMKTRPSRQVKDALVLNLLVRIDLLNQHLHKLEQKYSGQQEETAPGKDPEVNA